MSTKLTKMQLQSRLNAARQALAACANDARRALPAKSGAVEWRGALEKIIARAEEVAGLTKP